MFNHPLNHSLQCNKIRKQQTKKQGANPLFLLQRGHLVPAYTSN